MHYPSSNRAHPRSLRRALGVAVLVSLWASGCARPESVWLEAAKAFEERRYDQAADAMARLARLRSPRAEDHMMRAQLAMVRDDVDTALVELAQVPDSFALAPRARLQSGQIELRRDRARIAERFILEAIKLNPDLTQAHRELIYIYGMQLRRPELGAEFRALARLEALSFSDVFLWCLTRGSTWETSEVVETLGKFLDADPDDRASRIALVEVLRQMTRDAEAEAKLAPLTNEDPDARAARVRLALDRGDEATAESLLAAAPRNHLDLAILRGRLAMARNDPKAAVVAFRDAVRVDPNHRDAVFGLARALQQVDDPEARTYLEISHRLERLGTLVQLAGSEATRKNPQLVRDLGAACADVGRIPEARAWYCLAIKLNPLDGEAQQALFRLKTDNPAK
jgi:tetratricopeptide (TPR) repeat protein